MKYFHIMFVLMVVGAVVSIAINHTYSGQEIKDNTVETSASAIDLEPYEIKPHMKDILKDMDKNKNGFIERNELSDKLFATYMKILTQEADLEFQNNDHDGDGYVTWNEYVDHTPSTEDFTDDIIEYVSKKEKTIYSAADVDGDGILSKIEFRYLYAPDEYPHMLSVAMNRVTDRFGTDEHRKTSFAEFIEEMEKYTKEWLQEENINFIHGFDLFINEELKNDAMQNSNYSVIKTTEIEADK